MRKLVRVALLAVLAGFVTPLYAGVTNDETASLLRLLAEIRDKTSGECKSATGLATVVSTEGSEPKTQQVDFKFLGSASIVRIRQTANSPETRLLWREGKQCRYVLPGGGPQSSVRITEAPLGALVSDDLVGWSFVDLMRIPIGSGLSDKAVFQSLLTEDCRVTASRSGAYIKVDVVAPPDPRGWLREQKWVLTFDPSMGGVLTEVRFNTWHAKGTEGDLSEVLELKWARDVSGAITPVSRQITAERKSRQGNQGFGRTIEFVKFEPKAIDDNEVQFKSLEVAVGTRIVDSIVNVEWKYNDLEPNLPSDDVLFAAVKEGRAKLVTSENHPNQAPVSQTPILVGGVNNEQFSAWQWTAIVGVTVLSAVLLFRLARRLRKRYVSGTCLLLCALAMCAVTVGCDQKTVAETGLSAEPTVLNVGHVKMNGAAAGKVRLVNNFDREVSIVAVESTCGCTVPKVGGTVLGPGASTDVAVTFDAKGYSRAVQTAVVVRGRSSRGDFAVLVPVRAYVDVGITVSPQRIDLGEGKPGTLLPGRLFIDADRCEDIRDIRLSGGTLKKWSIGEAKWTGSTWRAAVEFQWAVPTDSSAPPSGQVVVTAGERISGGAVVSCTRGAILHADSRVVAVSQRAGETGGTSRDVFIHGIPVGGIVECNSLYSVCNPSVVRTEQGVAIRPNVNVVALAKVGFDVIDVKVVLAGGVTETLSLPVVLAQ